MGVWYRAGTVAVASGSKTVTGTGTQWQNLIFGVAPGVTFYGPDGKPYEIDTVNSNTSLTLVTNYSGTTASGQAYAIDPTRSGSVASLAAQTSEVLKFSQGQFTQIQNWFTGAASADVTLTSPAGQQITVPSYSKVTSEGEGQAARAKAEADKAAVSAEEAKSAPRAAIPYMDFARYGINGKTPTLSLDFIKAEHRIYEGMGVGFNLKPLAQIMPLTRPSSATAQGPTAIEQVGNDVMRIVYRDGVKLGGVVEPQTTNLMLWPHPIAQGGSNGNQGQWYYNDNTRVTLSSVSVTLPDGTTGSASRAVGLNTGYVRFSIGGVAGFTASLFVRDIVGQLILRGIAAGYTPWTATINADGSVATSPTTGSLTVEKYPNGWFRIGMYDPAATNSYELQLGSGSANALTIWGGQLESGSVMTSYIPTAGTQVTRTRELFRRDSSAPLLSSSMSVIFVGRKQPGVTNVFWSLDDGADSDKVILESDTSGGIIRAKVFSGATEVARVNGPSSNTPSQRFKAAVSYDNATKRLSLAVNGVIYTASVGSASLSKVLNRISCGCTVGGFGQGGQPIEQFAVIPSVLTDAELIEATK